MFKFVWRYLKLHDAALGIALFCSVLSALIDLSAPYLTAKFIDEILISGDSRALFGFVAVLILISVTAVISQWFNRILSTKMRLALSNQLVEELMCHVQKLRSEVLFTFDMVYLANRVDKDASDLVSFVISSALEACMHFALICMAVFLLGSIGGKWLAIFVIIAILHFAAYNLLKKSLFQRSREVRETDAQYFTDLSDNFLYMQSIKIHSLYDEYRKKFRASFGNFFDAVIRETKISFWFTTSTLNANEIFRVLIFFLGGLDVLAKEMTIGNFVALNGYYMFAMQGIGYFMSIGQAYQNARAAYIRIMEIKNVPPEITGTKILPRVESITVQNVSYSFGDKIILQNFTRKFERGRIYCIVGKNGAGKSTLINLICGILRPARGEISCNEIPIAELDMIHTRKKNIAVVEQKDFRKNETLSGGERKKISIGAAFEKGADVLIFDEPDNNLDASAVAELLEKIKSGAENRITLIISHDERLTAIADEIVNLSAKKLKE